MRTISERPVKIKGDISAYRFANILEPQMKDLIIRRYDLTPTYVQNILDDDSDPKEFVAAIWMIFIRMRTED